MYTAVYNLPDEPRARSSLAKKNLILMTQTLSGTVNVFLTSESWKFFQVQAGTFLFCNLVRKLSMKVVTTGKFITKRVVKKTFVSSCDVLNSLKP